MSQPNRKRDLSKVKLSEEARADVRRLRSIRRSKDRVEVLKAEMIEIWCRRNEAKDVKQTELARLSGVTQPYVARMIAEKEAAPELTP